MGGPRADPDRRQLWTVVVGLVVVFLVVPALWFVLSFRAPGICHGCGGGNPEIGTAFATGNAVLTACPANCTFQRNGCAGADFAYTLRVTESTIDLGGIGFEVLNTTGGIDTASGALGFSVLNSSGVLVAQDAVLGGLLSSQGATRVYSVGSADSTPLTTGDTIVLDVGTLNPRGEGLAFVALGMGSYSGSTSPLLLP